MTADKRALIAALALHGLALVAVRALPPPRLAPPPPPPADSPGERVEVTLEEVVVPVPAPQLARVAAESSAAMRNASATTQPEHPGQLAVSAADAREGEVTIAEAGPAPAAAGSGTTIEWARRGPIDLGLDGTVRMAQVGPDKPGAAPAAGGLGAALDTADTARGIWRGGPVRSAVEEAARGPEAPAFGTATFAVAIGKDGNVSIDVMAASSDRTNWERLAPAVREALTKKTLRLPPNSGLRVTVRVEASEQYPGGARPVPPEKQGVSAHGNGFKLVETKDHIDIVLPSAVIAVSGRKCGAAIAVGATGISGAAGCADGVAMRVVAARIVNEERL